MTQDQNRNVELVLAGQTFLHAGRTLRQIESGTFKGMDFSGENTSFVEKDNIIFQIFEKIHGITIYINSFISIFLGSGIILRWVKIVEEKYKFIVGRLASLICIPNSVKGRTFSSAVVR